MRAPCWMSSCSIVCCIYMEPWQAISIVFSPVNECGAWKRETNTSSMEVLVSGFIIVPYVIVWCC